MMKTRIKPSHSPTPAMTKNGPRNEKSALTFIAIPVTIIASFTVVILATMLFYKLRKCSECFFIRVSFCCFFREME